MSDNLWPDELKILVIDDEREILNLIRLSLEPAGFRILRTNKPNEGLSLALQELPDLLLLDLMMPGLDGYELLRRARRHPNLSKIPVIIISAKVNPTQQRMMEISQPHEDTIDAFIGKPFDPAELLRTVKKVLMKHKTFLLEKNKPQERLWTRIQNNKPNSKA